MGNGGVLWKRGGLSTVYTRIFTSYPPQKPGLSTESTENMCGSYAPGAGRMTTANRAPAARPGTTERDRTRGAQDGEFLNCAPEPLTQPITWVEGISAARGPWTGRGPTKKRRTRAGKAGGHTGQKPTAEEPGRRRAHDLTPKPPRFAVAHTG